MAVQAAAAEPGAHSIKWKLDSSSKKEKPSVLLLFDLPKVSIEQTVKLRFFDLVGKMSPENRDIFDRAFEDFESYEKTLKQKGIDDDLAAFQQQWKVEFAGHSVY